MEDVSAAVAALRAGQVVLLPTDTVYGLAALPTVPGATAALFRAKGRPADTPLAVLVADRGQALGLCEPPSEGGARLMDAFWPGPCTLVLPRAASAADLELGGDPATIGLRWPRHTLVQAIAAQLGPIATTSANRHGEATPTRAAAAAASLVEPPAAVIDGGTIAGTASTVIAVGPDGVRILRAGALDEATVQAVWHG